MPDYAKLGHIDQRLTDVSVRYNQDEFVGQNLIPEVPVVNGSDKFSTYNKGNMFITEDDAMSREGDALLIQGGSSDDNYSVNDRALKGYVTEEDKDNADDPLNPEIDTTEMLTSAIILAREIRTHAIFNGISQRSSPTTKWDDTGGDPVTDIEAALNTCFIRPNRMVLSLNVWNKIKYNAKVLEKIGGGFAGLKMARVEMLKELFELDELYIGRARKNAKRAKNTPSLSRVWGNDVCMAYVNPTVSIKSCTFGKLMAQKMGGGPTFRVRTWEQADKGVGGRKYIQVEHRSVEKVVCADVGYQLYTCLL